MKRREEYAEGFLSFADSFCYQGGEKHMYFFTHIHPTSAHSRRAKRTAGSGFWDCKCTDTPIRLNSQVIGYKRQFTFRAIEEKEKTSWIMHEFRLPETSKFDGLVLCRIHVKRNKKNGEGPDTDDISAIVDVSVVADDGEQEKGEEEGRLAKRRRIVESGRQNGLMADYAETSSKNASSVLSSSSFLPATPGLVAYKEPELLTLGSSDAARISIHSWEQEETATEGRFENQKQLEEPDQQQGILTDNNEDSTEANKLSSLLNALEEFLLADDSSPLYAEFNASSFLADISFEEPEGLMIFSSNAAYVSQNTSSSSFLAEIPEPLPYEEPESVACNGNPVGEQYKTTREKRLEKRKQVEEPDLLQDITAQTNEECCRVETTEKADQAEFSALEDHICLDDFPPLDEHQFDASSYFPLDHPTEDNHILYWGDVYHMPMN